MFAPAPRHLPSAKFLTAALPSTLFLLYGFTASAKRRAALFYIREFTTEEGVYILGTGGKEIVNYPEQHHTNEINKRGNTAHRFKKVVRTMKRLRDELVSLGELRSQQVPSFLVESLVYGVLDAHFLVDEDRYERIKRILEQIWANISNPLSAFVQKEINGVKPLFIGQSWAIDDAKAFVQARLRAPHFVTMWSLLGRTTQLTIIVAASFLFLSGIQGIYQWVVGVPTNPLKWVSLIVFLVGTVLVGAANFLWRPAWRVFPVLGRAIFPDINGEWDGTITSTWTDPATGRQLPPIPVKFWIRRKSLYGRRSAENR